MKIFDLDSPLMNVLNKMADLMWLNILTLICCIPIITAGAAFTSMHYVALKIVRNEESYITRSFFKSFKTNFPPGYSDLAADPADSSSTGWRLLHYYQIRNTVQQCTGDSDHGCGSTCDLYGTVCIPGTCQI